MIKMLRGTIKVINDNSLVVDVKGVGYLVACPTLTNNFSADQDVVLHTYLAVRETAMDLYGFVDPNELHMFEMLLGVPKVGPKSALQIMCLTTPKLLAEAAHKDDAQYLHKLSGVGKKTCENVVDYLNKKLDKIPESISKEKDEYGSLNQIQTDAIDALVALGYDLNSARETISKLSPDHDTVNKLVTQSLKEMN